MLGGFGGAPEYQTATFPLDRSLVAETETVFLGFIQALIRGQRDSYLSEGRTALADVLTTVLAFVDAELRTRSPDSWPDRDA